MLANIISKYTLLFALLLPAVALAQEEMSVEANEYINSESPYVDISDISEADMDDIEQYSDELEPFNRVMFNFNEVLDQVVFKPLSKVYEFMIPEWGRDRIHAFLMNLHEPVYFANHVLQLEGEKAGTNMGRFLSNTTWGMLGFIDIAKEAGIPSQPTDFGLTLKKAGLGTGPYLVLPVLGPSSFRDAPAFAVDLLMDPWGYYDFNAFHHPSRVHDIVLASRYGLEAIDKRQRMNRVLENIEKTSLDKYVAIRSMYMQKR